MRLGGTVAPPCERLGRCERWIISPLRCVNIQEHWRNKLMEATDMEAYCLKCREKRDMSNEEQVKLKNGRPATKGDYPACGTKMFQICKF